LALFDHIWSFWPFLAIFDNFCLFSDWMSSEQGQGEEYLYHSVQVKNVWLTMGDIFAN
jgi:hypothetical protein